MSFDYTELELTPFDKEIVKYLQSLTGRVHHAAMNALHHLERAKKISDIDPEMSAFRAIIAEEEAATAFFITLKQLGYERAKKLNHRDHQFKAGLFPFITAVHHQIHNFTPPISEAKLTWEDLSSGGKSENLKVILKVTTLDEWLVPEPPLNFHVSNSDQLVYF